MILLSILTQRSKSIALVAAGIATLAAVSFATVNSGFFKASLQNFPDVSADHPYAIAIADMRERGIIHGYPDGLFRPDNRVTRAELAKLITATLTTSEDRQHCITDLGLSPLFSDVRDMREWFVPFLCAAKQNGILSGYPDGSVKPGQDVNAVETAKIVANAYSLATTWPVPDDPWYARPVAALHERNLIPSTIVSGEHKVTRGELAEILHRYLSSSTSPVVHPELQELLWQQGASESVTSESGTAQSAQTQSQGNQEHPFAAVQNNSSQGGVAPAGQESSSAAVQNNSSQGAVTSAGQAASTAASASTPDPRFLTPPEIEFPEEWGQDFSAHHIKQCGYSDGQRKIKTLHSFTADKKHLLYVGISPFSNMFFLETSGDNEPEQLSHGRTPVVGPRSTPFFVSPLTRTMSDDGRWFVGQTYSPGEGNSYFSHDAGFALFDRKNNAVMTLVDNKDSDSFPGVAISRNGVVVAYTARDVLVVYDRNTRETREIGQGAFMPTLNRDGTYIAYLRNERLFSSYSVDYALFLQNLETGQEWRIGYGSTRMVISDDGRYVGYRQSPLLNNASTLNEAFIFDRDMGTSTSLVPATDVLSGLHDMSADGRIVLLSRRFESDPHRWRLFLYDWKAKKIEAVIFDSALAPKAAHMGGTASVAILSGDGKAAAFILDDALWDNHLTYEHINAIYFYDRDAHEIRLIQKNKCPGDTEAPSPRTYPGVWTERADEDQSYGWAENGDCQAPDHNGSPEQFCNQGHITGPLHCAYRCPDQLFYHICGDGIVSDFTRDGTVASRECGWRCGDGIVFGKEECDEGADTGNPKSRCSPLCTLRHGPGYSRLPEPQPLFESIPSQCLEPANRVIKSIKRTCSVDADCTVFISDSPAFVTCGLPINTASLPAAQSAARTLAACMGNFPAPHCTGRDYSAYCAPTDNGQGACILRRDRWTPWCGDGRINTPQEECDTGTDIGSEWSQCNASCKRI